VKNLLVKQLVIAFQFLTVIPVRVRGDISERELSQSVVFFPAVGAFQGLLAGLAAYVFAHFFTADMAAAFVMTVLVMSNGGFHLDGVADTFDAVAVKSSGDADFDRGRRLSVMKDGTTGPIGVTAVVFAVLLKYLLLKDLLSYSSTITIYSLLFLMPVLSKWVMVAAMYYGTSARNTGLGRIFADAVALKDAVIASLVTLLFCLAVAELMQHTLYAGAAAALFFFVIASLYIFTISAVKFCGRHFGGLTGDTFGAIGDLSEIVFLMVTALWLRHSI